MIIFLMLIGHPIYATLGSLNSLSLTVNEYFFNYFPMLRVHCILLTKKFLCFLNCDLFLLILFEIVLFCSLEK